MPQPTAAHLAFADRLNKASGWPIWDTTMVGRLNYESITRGDYLVEAAKTLETALKNHPVVQFGFNGNSNFGAGRPVLNTIHNERFVEDGLCLCTANDADMEAAITAFETDLKPALRSVMRELALKTYFMSAIEAMWKIEAGKSRISYNDYLCDAFKAAGDRAGQYVVRDIHSKRYADASWKLTYEAGKFKTTGDMLAHGAGPEILRTAARNLMPVLNDPAA